MATGWIRWFLNSIRPRLFNILLVASFQFKFSWSQVFLSLCATQSRELTPSRFFSVRNRQQPEVTYFDTVVFVFQMPWLFIIYTPQNVSLTHNSWAWGDTSSSLGEVAWISLGSHIVQVWKLLHNDARKKNVFLDTILSPLISPSSCHGLEGVPLLIVSAAIASIRPETESNRQSWFAFPLAQLLRWATTTAAPSKPCAGAQSMAKESFPRGGVVTAKTSCRFDRW